MYLSLTENGDICAVTTDGWKRASIQKGFHSTLSRFKNTPLFQGRILDCNGYKQRF